MLACAPRWISNISRHSQFCFFIPNLPQHTLEGYLETRISSAFNSRASQDLILYRLSYLLPAMPAFKPLISKKPPGPYLVIHLTFSWNIIMKTVITCTDQRVVCQCTRWLLWDLFFCLIWDCFFFFFFPLKPSLLFCHHILPTDQGHIQIFFKASEHWTLDNHIASHAALSLYWVVGN